MKLIDNNVEKLKDSLISEIKKDDKIAIAASCFSMYAFKELMEQLKDISELRFIFTSSAVIKNERAKKGRKNDSRNEFEDVLAGTAFETQLRDVMSQKAIACEFADWIRKENIQFRAKVTNEPMTGYAVVSSSDRKHTTAYAPLLGFTTVDLGCADKKDVLNLIQEIEAPYSKQYLSLFDSIWKDKKKLIDVKDIVIQKIAEVCKENSPEYIYYIAIYNIFSGFLNDISDDDFFANDKAGFKNSVIWNKLFDFQKDAALAIINKLERYNGCILADSVGLGKTYTALAVIKYYESRNKSVLVLCPKKLSENWNGFRGNFINNPLIKDRFRYDVLYHTDLSRTGRNAISNGINLSLLNWGNYDLVVIDESHNFRNGGSGNYDKMNRYDILLEKVIRNGVKTKVLMLSATPVNNRFNDLRNQLQLAYEDGDPSKLEEQLNVRNTIDGIFKKAQSSFNKWSNLEPSKRTTDALLDRLDVDFFELLDSVTIARSRKQIQSFYDMKALGAFPQRLCPKSVSPSLTNIPYAADYDEIFEKLLKLWLTIYTPSHYILPERRAKYAEQFGDKIGNESLSQENREQGLRRLMAINLMKRLESSIYSFKLTLERIRSQIDDTISKIDCFLATHESMDTDGYFDIYGDEDDIQGDLFSVGKKIKISLSDMNVTEWRKTLIEDRNTIDVLRKRISTIDAKHDNKLRELLHVIDEKVKNPLNGENKKILIFTAFADTAEYLYKYVSQYAKRIGLNTAMITGTIDGRSTIADLHCDFNTILTWFSPKSKERNLILGGKSAPEIDILIGTDCISEGQNLQDCDFCVNYDIHWNPVRIIQRYGRIDRIGSENKYIQLVNFWPDVSLDEYINLKQRVETRMKIVNITATPEEKVLSDEEKIDLEYRKTQLERLRTEVIDIEDVSTSVSITDLGLNEFKLDLLDYTKNNKINTSAKNGLYAVARSTQDCPPGMILVLRNTRLKSNIRTKNRLHPFYLVYISDRGDIVYNYLNSKEVLSTLRLLCKGETEPIISLCERFNKETQNGYNMCKYTNLLNSAVKSIVEVKRENDISGLFRAGGTHLGALEKIEGSDDFDLVCFLVIK